MSILGILVNALNQINLPSSLDIFYGELLFIIIGFVYFLINIKEIFIKKGFLYSFLVPFCILCVYIIFYYFLPIIYYNNILKILLKYIEITLITTFTYIICMKKRRSYLKFIIWIPIFNYINSFIQWSKMGEPLYSLHMSGSNLVLLMILLIENYINRVIYKMIIFTFFIIILVIGFSRTGLIIACCYGFITILKFFRNKKYKNKYKKVLIIYSTFIFLSATITSLIIILINNLHLQTASNVERTTLMQISWDMFKKSWIYGIGPDNFNTFLYNYKELLPYTSDESMKTLAPHNVFLENLVQFGIIGFFLFTIPLIYLLVKSYKNKSFRSDNLNLLLYVIILLVTSVISGNNRFLFSSILGYLFYQADYSYSNRRLQR